MNTLEQQLSAPRRQLPESNTPQPEEPLEINMPTPVTVAVTVAPAQPAIAITTTAQAAPVASTSTAPAVAAPIAVSTAAETTTTSATATTATSQPQGPQAQFAYNDINILSLGSLQPLVTFNEQIQLLTMNPNLKNCVRSAIERTAHEVVAPVVERTVKISVTTCENIIKKVRAILFFKSA